MPLCVLLARCLLLACRGCSLRDSDYAQVFQDLAPFREGGGVDEAMLRRLSAALPGTLLASVGGGAPVRFAGADDEERFPAHTAFWRDLLGELTTHLPPIKLLLNALDEARRWAGGWGWVGLPITGYQAVAAK